jgi:hypothetical protein
LENVQVASPCSESWDEMVGDERARLCLKCDKNVYDVSAMTRDEAEALIAQSEGQAEGLCLRFYRRKDGTILTADCPVGRRRRRVTRVAAAALAFGGGALALHAYERSCTMGEMVAQPPADPTVAEVDPSQMMSELDEGDDVMGEVSFPRPGPRGEPGGGEDGSEMPERSGR